MLFFSEKRYGRDVGILYTTPGEGVLTIITHLRGKCKKFLKNVKQVFPVLSAVSAFSAFQLIVALSATRESLRIAAAILSGSANTPLIIATDEAPAPITSARFARVIPPIATSGI